MLNVVVLGGGKGGCSLLPILLEQKNVRVLGIADKNPSAPGIELAKNWNIPTVKDVRSLIIQEKVDVIIDVTGNRVVDNMIYALKSQMLRY